MIQDMAGMSTLSLMNDPVLESGLKKFSAFMGTPAGMVIMVGLTILASEFLLGLLFWGLHNVYLADELEEEIAVGIVAPIMLTAIVSPVLYLLIFRPMVNQHAELERQLDKLRRFQKVTVGRELRMKELAEENAALRNRPASGGPDGTAS